MPTTMTQIACDLNEQVENKYALVLEISDIAKRLLDDYRQTRMNDPFASMENEVATTEKVIYQALIMKASEIDTGGLIG